ncbi:MAG TPA: hypothetical protein VFT64_08135 [Rickettsiales bacterium]|nr:hypothetical protein [Rickettsiales bacterium]
MRKIAIAPMVLFLAGLSACNDTAVPYKEPVSFAGEQYTLNVAGVNVVDEYQSSKELPNVELLSDITPAQAMRQWSDERLVAKGNTGRAEVVIKDAHIVQKSLPKKKSGVEGYFTTEQTQELNGRLEVEIKIYDGISALPLAMVQASSESSMTLPENATIMDRNKAYHAITVELVHRIEPPVVQGIQGHFGKFMM